MRPSIDRQSTHKGSHRLLSGVGLLVFFGAFFVMPLCAALVLCAMPCCEHGTSDSGSIVKAGMVACATECSIRANEASSTVVPSLMPESGAERSVPVVTAVAVVTDGPAIAPTAAGQTVGSARGADAPLHLLNSTFRI